jgi:hypothetical protein
LSFDLEAKKQEIRDLILDEGFAVIHLDPTENRPSVSHTVGRTMYARPELVVMGFDETEGKSLLAAAVALDHDQPLEPGLPCRLQDRAFNVRSTDPRKADMVHALAIFGNCEALQLSPQLTEGETA